METADYRSHREDREDRRVESAVEDARRRVKTANDMGDYIEREKAWADLEEAKDNREQYYSRKNK